MTKKINENLLLTGLKFIKQKEFWLNQMVGEIAETKLLFDNKKSHGLPENCIKIDIPFPGHLCGTVAKLGKQSDIAIYIILLAALKLLLYRYGGNEDITVLSPVYQEFISAETINDSVFIRDRIDGDASFKELLLQCKQSVLDAYENQDYPHERLVDMLFEKSPERENRCISNVVCALKNLHGGSEPELVNNRFIFLFNREADRLEGNIFCAPGNYDGYYIGQIIHHFITILGSAVQDVDEKISRIALMSKEEKERLIRDFNDTEVPYPTGRTIHQWFEEQAAGTPDGVALVGNRLGAALVHPADKGAVGNEKRNGYSLQLTYRELNKRSDRLARLLQEKGVVPDTIVGIMVERSVELIVGILGILKAGGAYLPIDPEYPRERIDYMLADSAAKVLVISSTLAGEVEKLRSWEVKKVFLEEVHKTQESSSQPLNLSTSQLLSSSNLAYIIYTSGTTGKPKGVMIEHQNLTAYVNSFLQEFRLTANDIMMQQASASFDAYVEEVFPILTRGGKIAIPHRQEIIDMDLLSVFILKNNVTFISCTPLLLNELNKVDNIKSITTFISGGDELRGEHVDRLVKQGNVYNTYGPTESTVCVTYYKCPELPGDTIPIGRPISNYKVYILDKSSFPVPIGVPGEIYAAGAGVARGYLNRPGLTAKKFINNPFAGGLLYRTGDLGRWLPHGNIEFLGRIDHQVKIRGYRIELGEIENLLKKYDRVKDAVIVVKEDETGDKCLCAYYISGREIPVSALREHTAVELPDYMIPSFFVNLEKMPLTPGGKINRSLLESLEVKVKSDGYIAPQNDLEKKLAKIWAEVLGLEEEIIGIDNNFFELGGHSLKATALASEIHRAFNVKIPLREIFNTPTLGGCADYIGSRTTETFTSIESVEKKQYYPLSSAQKRQYIMQQTHPGSTSYNMPTIIYLDRSFNKHRLEETFRRLIKRHESFRTSFNILEERPVQVIHEDVEFEIECLEPGDFVRPFDLGKAPLLRVGLIDTPEKITLLVDLHHIIADGASHDILREEFQTVYEGKELPGLRLQYRDYAEWQNSKGQQTIIEKQEAYWLKIFADGPPVLNLPADYPRPLMQSFEGSTLKFLLTLKETRALKALAAEIDATLYMSILSIFSILLSTLSGQEDIIVGTAIMGRRHADLKGIIGMFVNTLALRYTPPGEQSYKEFLRVLKERTLAAYENQEYPFEELVDKITGRKDTGRNPVFDVMFSLLNEDEYQGDIPGLDEEDLYLYQHRKGTSKFDLTLTAIDRGERMLLAIEYCTKLFEPVTIERFANCFKKIVSSIITDPGMKLGHIEIISAGEKKQVLYDFNDADCQYPEYKSLQQLFAEQVEQTPHHLALVGESIRLHREVSLTYKELNQKSNRLARLLRNKGSKPDTIVGIMVERSLEMIIGISGILKSGGAYLPIPTDYPGERVRYMLKDGGVEILLTQNKYAAKYARNFDVIDLESADIYKGAPDNLPAINASKDLIYIIYTSGSTGRPRGVMVQHANVSRVVKTTDYIDIEPSDIVLQLSNYAFDGSVFDIFGALANGAKLVIVTEENLHDVSKLSALIKNGKITIFFVTTALFNVLIDINIECFATIRHVLFGGERVSYQHVKKALDYMKAGRIIHMYGPTESTVYSTYYLVNKMNDTLGTVPIGKPLSNTEVYILDKHMKPVPIGAAGEIFIGGYGLARGYLNNPELTAEKFFSISNKSYRSYRTYISKTIYKTGDLARWLPDGNIEFLDRIDTQVKLRGFRVELGEIESYLRNIEGIKEAVVIPGEDNKGDKYLCAYIVKEKQHAIGFSGIKKKLAENLPTYMIPAYFAELDEIPLNANGKIDKKSLPEPGIIVEKDYIAPENDIERRLVDIWSEVLNIDKEVIGINSSFFDLGGHSLKVLTLTAKIHKELGVEIPLMEIFKTPSIKRIARYIDKSAGNRFEMVKAAEERGYYPLSTAQLGIFSQQFKENETVVYNMSQILPLGFDIDRDRMTQTFTKLIKRHESLRTSFQMVDGKPVQKVYPFDKVEFEIECHDLAVENTNSRPEDIIDDFLRSFDLSQPPLLRASLIKVEKKNYILLFDMHHIISDGVSGGILRKEFLALYDGKDLPPLRLQYKDYSVWQNSKKVREVIKRQKEFWLKTFAEIPPVLRMPLDFERPTNKRFEGDIIYFTIESQLTGQLKRLEKQTGATLYMVLLSAYFILLSRYTNQEDIVVGSPVTGRKHADLQDIIGMLVNMISIRTQPVRDKTFREFLEEVKTQVIDSLENQDYHFEELVVRLGLQGDPGRNPLFDVVFSMGDMNAGTMKKDRTEDNNKSGNILYEFNHQIVPFDLIMGAGESNGTIEMCLAYSTSLFKRSTIERMMEHFIDILRQAAESDDDIRLRDILISHNLIAVAADIYKEDLEEFEF
jgi:tyrocidine synthetase-3